LLYKALAFRPDCAEYSGKLGMALGSVGRGEEALDALDRAVELDAGLAEAHYNRGVILDRLGRGDEAVAAWRRAVELRPGYDDALCMLGQKLLARNETDAALGHLREAVRVNPRHAAAQNNLGIGLRKAGDSAAAAAHFRRGSQKGGARKGTRSVQPDVTSGGLVAGGRPGGRSVRSNRKARAVSTTQVASPKGVPRCAERRRASSSASVSGRFTCSTQSRGSGTGHSDSTERSFSVPRSRRQRLDQRHCSARCTRLARDGLRST
jgi:hypothetical protein